MGYLTMHNYDQNTKKWNNITPKDLYISNYNEMDAVFLNKFCPEIQNQDLHRFEKYTKVREAIQEKGSWYDKCVFNLCTTTFALYTDIPKLIQAFEILDKEASTQYAKEMIKYLQSLLISENKNIVLSFGHSVGGFWGTDSEHITKSISIKLSDSVLDKILDHTNINPFSLGTRFFCT